MSEETNKPASPVAENAEEKTPAGPGPGEFGKRLDAAGICTTPLGTDAGGVEVIEVPREVALKTAQFLRDDCRFDLMLSCAGVDRKEYRESVYHLYSLETHQYVILKIRADEQERSPSLMPIYPAADWHERESYDLMGIIYDGHPDLRRILMPVDWLGHPLRKDYKVDDPRLVWNER